ncbi:MAG: beta-ketoacyl-ACP synthase II [Dehalococcoidia bacterium]
MEKVVVTGIGAVTPVGLTARETWENLLAGRSGVGAITAFDATHLPVRIAGEVKGFDPTHYMDQKAARRMARFAQFAVACSVMALKDAGLTVTEDNADRIGVVINTGGGGMAECYTEALAMQRRGPGRVSPFHVPLMAPNMAACQPSIMLGIRGPVVSAVAACAAGVQAFTDALHILRRGEADALLAGGTESGLVDVPLASLANAGALAGHPDDPTRASRPFDRNRTGFVYGEGAAVLVLEREEHARARGARIYAEVAGGAITGDAYHVTMPEPNGAGAILAMRRALQYSGVPPEEIDYICAHGTGTPLNDVTETMAIKAVFGAHASRLAVSSPKSMIGHLLGAAGAVSALVCVLACHEQRVPPTINLENPDPACDLDYVPHVAREMTVRAALANGFGFGGQNAVAVVRRYQE